MFFSQSKVSAESATFQAILNSYLDGENKFESIVNQVLAEAIQLAKGEKQAYEIQSDYFSTAVYLNECCSEFLSGLPQDNITHDQFKAIADSLNEQQPAF